jgi:hypothetical protein
VKDKFVRGYQEDLHFQDRYTEDAANPKKVLTPSHFQKGKDRLLYFVDVEWRNRLCIPRTKVQFVLQWIYESPHESAHAGPFKFINQLRELFFWTTLTKDADEFASTCDICQKIKVDHQQKMGRLRPAHIPPRPFATVSRDPITGLPPSGKEKFTAILVIVDKLTRFSVMVPTHTNLVQEGFMAFFVERVVNVFGMPEHIISDCDKRWATAFWCSVTLQYGSMLVLSSAHHPQTDRWADRNPQCYD